MSPLVQPIQSINILLKIVKIFGVFPSIRKFSTFYSCVLFIICLCLYFYSVTWDQDEREVTLIANHIVSVSFVFSFVINILMCLLNKNKLLQILNKFQNFDKLSTVKVHFEYNYKKNTNLVMLIVIFLTIYLFETAVVECLNLVKNSFHSILRWLLNFFPLIVKTFYQALIFVFIIMLYQRFSKINNSLEDILKPSITTIVGNKEIVRHTNINYKIEILKNLNILNDDLRSLANYICTTFSLPILINFGNNFLVCTVQMYHMVTLLKIKKLAVGKLQDDKLKEFSQLIDQQFLCMINSLLFHCLQLIAVVAAFYFTKEKVIFYIFIKNTRWKYV